ncbi:MFS general substrate transporter [Nemania sp. NC0429]|nr:MFS general substrate transporter [Nemania sp. NC0429]KAI1109918.1 MFS general substrate transporter [Nemania sp. NC0429]
MASDSKIAPPTQVEDADAISPATRPNAPPATVLADKAAQFISQHGVVSYTYEEERAVLKRVDMRILPLLLGAYFFQQLDKSSLSYVSIFGIIDDAHLTSQEYSWLGSILYFGQLAFQPLAAFLLVRLPTGKVIGTAIVLWGISETLLAVAKNFPALIALRFFLGAFEALIAPSCIAITQMWWLRSEQTLRNSYWNAMNGVTAVVGSLVTYGLGHIITEKLFRYQIIFLFCGLLTVLFGLTFLYFMPDSPMEAKYLSERDQLIAVERLRANQMGVASRQWRWDHAIETLLDLKTWLWFFAMTSISIASGGISTFGNLIVKDFGFTNFNAILFNIPFGVIQVGSIVGSAWLATRLQRKGLVLAITAAFPIIGTILMLTVPRNGNTKGALLFGYYLVSFLGAITPMIFTWQGQNTGGDTKRKTTTGVVIVGMCTGNIIGPHLFDIKDAPLYRPGLIASLVQFAFVGALGLLIPVYLMYLNKRHAAKRVQLGKRADLQDKSMMTKKDQQQPEDEEAEQKEHITSVEDDNGLQDLSDLQNEDFIYVY